MSLTGFPQHIKAVLGEGWTGQNGLDAYDVLILSKVSGQNVWTEDGTDTPDSPGNRLRFAPYVSGAPQAGLSAFSSGTSWQFLGSARLTYSDSTYTFLEVWSNTASITGNWSSGRVAGFLTSFADEYNAEIFSSLQAAAPGDLNVVESAVPIPDGLAAPRRFGQIEKDAPRPQKAFTVQNLGDVSITVTGVNLPAGYSFGAGNQLPNSQTVVAGGQSKSLIVELATDTVGVFAGDVEIISDDPDEPTYNFAVTGTVVTDDKIAVLRRRSRWARMSQRVF